MTVGKSKFRIRPWLQSVVLVGLLAMTGSMATDAVADERPRVIATFSILADLTRAVGGDLIDLDVLVAAKRDTHLFDPRPADARRVAAADLVVANGLNFENFLPGLLAAAEFSGRLVIASDGVRTQPIRSSTHELDREARALSPTRADRIRQIDPHAWHDLENAKIYVGNIATALAEVDPDNARTYQRNASRYLAEIAQLDLEIRSDIDALAPDRRLMITSHDAFGYLATAYGLQVVGISGVSTGNDPSAGDLAMLIEFIGDVGAQALFVEFLGNTGLAEQIARETGVAIGGALYSDTLSEPSGPAATFLQMMRHNADTIIGALAGG